MSTVEHDIVNMKGKKVGSIDLAASIFDVKVLPDLLHQVVRWQRAKRRAGTHCALNKGMMEGGNRKPWKQKGTGNARSGSNTSPVWVGGAVSHGPLPRDYEFSVPKKVKRRALTSALSQKRANGELVIVDDLQLASGKTKAMAEVLGQIAAEKRKVMLVVADAKEAQDALVVRASKNLAGVTTVSVAGVNVYDLVNAEVLVSTKAGIEALQERLQGQAVAA